MKAFANRRRLAILAHIKKHHKAKVGDIARSIDLSFAATSRHLGVLAAADIVEREQIGLEMWYRFDGNLPRAAERIIALLE